jgi:predicted nucleic acid-binding protein
MYLIDTNVISEARKGTRADTGVRGFFAEIGRNGTPLFLSVITVGELRRGVELIRHRGDALQARRLEEWLQSILADFADNILDVDAEIAQLWGSLCAPRVDNAMDKLIGHRDDQRPNRGHPQPQALRRHGRAGTESLLGQGIA